MEHLKLSAQPRELSGKAVRRLRREGVVPVVVYGGGVSDPISLQVAERELSRVLNAAGSAKVIDLQADGKSLPVLTRTVQRHPTRHNILHVDFLAVRMDQMIQAEVPVYLVGQSPLIESNQAIMTQVLNTVTVEALPDELPSQLEADISGLTELHQTLVAGSLTLPASVRLVTDAEAALVSLSAPRLAAAATETEEAETADEADEESAEE